MRTRAFISILVFLILGYGLKFYRGPGQEFVNNRGPASLIYECLLMCVVFFVIPKRRYAKQIAIGVCVFTCALEFLQLWKPPWLQSIRATLLGAAFLGNTFSWWDLPSYPLGCLMGYGWLLLLSKTQISDSPTSISRSRPQSD